MCIKKVSRVSFDFMLTSNLQPVGFYLFIFVDLLSVFQFQGNLQTWNIALEKSTKAIVITKYGIFNCGNANTTNGANLENEAD